MKYMAICKLINYTGIGHSRLYNFIEKYKIEKKEVKKKGYNKHQYNIKQIDKMVKDIEKQELYLNENYVESKVLNLTKKFFFSRVRNKNIDVIIFTPTKGHKKYFFKREDEHLFDNIKRKYPNTKYNIEISQDMKRDIKYYLHYKHNKKVSRYVKNKNQELLGFIVYVAENTDYNIKYTPNMGIIEHMKKDCLMRMWDSKEKFQIDVAKIKEHEDRERIKAEIEKHSRKRRYEKIIGINK